MKKYERGDTATFYFVISNFNGSDLIQGWTDNKNLAEAYMEFHKCKHFRLKKIHDTIDNFEAIIEDNMHDEIIVLPILTRDRSKKKPKVKEIYIPATETERMFMADESQTYLSTEINYSTINHYIPYLKNKYQKALNDILLNPVILAVVHNKTIPELNRIDFDYLAILYKCFPHNFGI